MVKDILSYGLGTLVAFVSRRRPGLPLHQRHHAEEARRAAQLPGRSAACATSSRSWASTSASTSSPATATRCRSTAPRAPGSTAWRRTRAARIGFGSTYDMHGAGRAHLREPPVPGARGGAAADAVAASSARATASSRSRRSSIVNISGMSFGAISAPAVRALSRGAAVAGCWMDTGEGGLVAVPPRGRLRHHHADRHRQVRHARRARQPVRRAAGGAGEGREGLRDQALAGREARQGRRAARARR